MRLFYCPKCSKEEISSNDIYRDEYTINNMRGGYGRPIKHYKCECGNYLAGSINIGGHEEDKNFIEYCKAVIEDYNKYGCFYDSYLQDKIDLFTKAKQAYEERKDKDKLSNENWISNRLEEQK